jgi:hypothetical protein
MVQFSPSLVTSSRSSQAPSVFVLPLMWEAVSRAQNNRQDYSSVFQSLRTNVRMFFDHVGKTKDPGPKGSRPIC